MHTKYIVHWISIFQHIRELFCDWVTGQDGKTLVYGQDLPDQDVCRTHAGC